MERPNDDASLVRKTNGQAAPQAEGVGTDPKAASEAAAASADRKDLIDQVVRLGIGTIDALARSARTEGPIAFTYAIGTILLGVDVVLRAIDRFSETDFLAALALTGVLMTSAGGLAVLRFRAATQKTAEIVRSSIDALTEDQEARDRRLAAAGELPEL